MADLVEQREAAIARVEQLKTALGDAITSGDEKKRAKAHSDLTEAQRIAADLILTVEAVDVAERVAAERAAREEEARQDADRAARVKAAHDGLATLARKAKAVDAAIAAALSAAADLKAAGHAYSVEHAGIGVHRDATVWLISPIRQIEDALRDHKSVAAAVPDMNFILTGRRPHKSREEKLKALGPLGVEQQQRRKQERIKNGLAAAEA